LKILAIETSCDETAVAILEIDGELHAPKIKILGNTLLSQASLHEKYGGVYPNLAKREHEKNLPIVLEETLKQAGFADTESEVKKLINEIDFIAVTAGPGLEPALWTGITFAEKLSKNWSQGDKKIPVIPINHMEGHIYSVLYGVSNDKNLNLPALALLISGGHTELVLVKDFGEYRIIGRTRDDAVGEAFDKVARMLGLPYPGGPKISELAQISRQKNSEDSIKLPRPMIHSKDLDFSFSGLKTSILYKVKEENENGELSEDYKEETARAFEDAVTDVLISKTKKALETYPETRSLIIGGGVSANKHLIEKIGEMVKEFPLLSLKTPADKSLSVDNAVMIGIAAFVKVTRDKTILENDAPIKAQGNLSFPIS
jgi:N6-L-threonylcarbamoyladenine synthase